MPTHPRRLRALVLLLFVVGLAAACADEGVDTAATDTPAATETAPLETPVSEDASPEDADTSEGDAVEQVPDGAAAGVEVSGEPGTKPAVTLPDDEPPTDLVVVDLIEGDGEEVPAGATVTTDYVGVSWENDGVEFDSSWDRGEPATFPLSGVIEGWTDGIPGMRVGGRRLLVIPPEQAYGAQAPSPDIAANDTLVFVIDLVDIAE